MELELQLAVERLHAQYAHAIDADQLEVWPNFFPENGRYQDRIALPEMKYDERVVICDSRKFDTLLAIPL